MPAELPLISCICVTYKKPAMLARAIACFRSQTYANKELLILYESDDLPTVHFLASQRPVAGIRYVCAEGQPKKTLGALRNLAVAAAAGEFICQWDDDDWYHMDRLLYQYNALMQHHVSGSILTRWLVYDTCSGRAFVSNKRRWEGSILCRRNVFTRKKYENKARGEDTDVIEYLHEHQHLVPIDDRPDLYLYVYHGANTWGLDHFSRIFEASQELTAHSAVVGEILANKYSAKESAFFLKGIPYSMPETAIQ